MAGFSFTACRNGHPLKEKVVAGTSLLGAVGLLPPKKSCSLCCRPLLQGALRHSCKACDYHLCHACGTPPPAPPVPAPPSGPAARAPRCPGTSSDGVAPRSSGSADLGGASSTCRRGAIGRGSSRVSFRGSNRRACRYGTSCYQKSPEHLDAFAHPGDRNYRHGLVVFEADQHPQFETLWQFFRYHDPDESGHLSKDEFAEVVRSGRKMGAIVEEVHIGDLEEEWVRAGGPLHGHVNFRQFTKWTEAVGVPLPLGLEAHDGGAHAKPCRFNGGGARCSCVAFEERSHGICRCGHKESMHRSDFAERSFSKFVEEMVDISWTPGQDGLVPVTDARLLQQLQSMMARSHKTSDNWTRDRGCSQHGVNGCSWACASRTRVAVPSGYVLAGAFRNQNVDLWQKFVVTKTAISAECARGDEAVERISVASHDDLDSALDASCNEVRLFHGTSAEKCRGICSSNFRLAMAGTGATWKDGGSDRGTPLYGFGIYLAERVTKADEYATQDWEGFYSILVCRVICGRSNIVTTNEIEVDKLRADVFDGPYHSVFGDREKTLGKPYREVVVYDKDQCYPEFLLTYARAY